eukprot:scaffold67854_cov20-Tisochrysis_lutea.AAC.7
MSLQAQAQTRKQKGSSWEDVLLACAEDAREQGSKQSSAITTNGAHANESVLTGASEGGCCLRRPWGDILCARTEDAWEHVPSFWGAVLVLCSQAQAREAAALQDTVRGKTNSPPTSAGSARIDGKEEAAAASNTAKGPPKKGKDKDDKKKDDKKDKGDKKKDKDDKKKVRQGCMGKI